MFFIQRGLVREDQSRMALHTVLQYYFKKSEKRSNRKLRN